MSSMLSSVEEVKVMLFKEHGGEVGIHEGEKLPDRTDNDLL